MLMNILSNLMLHQKKTFNFSVILQRQCPSMLHRGLNHLLKNPPEPWLRGLATVEVESLRLRLRVKANFEVKN